VHQPDTRVRGLQMHTLHPIEAYYAFWEPSPGNTSDAHRIIDWLIKNRGNYLHWVSLDNIMDPAIHEKWKPFTRELIDYAHMRGVRVGQNIQLFGSSNLQLAFDLSDDETVPLAESIAERLPLMMDDLPWDEMHLSFGEFFGEEPQTVVDGINEVARQMREKWPQTELHGFVHVGATQRVDYKGENLLYYFLLKYADPTVVPDIHTVMYYNLFDPADGAYQHTEFNEHRDYLVQRMCAGLPHSYIPESGYWVAFDNSIPSYLPLYVYSRWRDIDGLRNIGCGKPLDNHTLFTTGWEWGYWLHDYANLRDVYEHATEPADLIEHAYGPDFKPQAIDLIAQMMNEQKRALMDDKLAGYIASRDVIIDQGRRLDPPIISQPDRTQFDQITSANVDQFATTVLAPLEIHADNLAALERQLDQYGVPDSRWGREVHDGFVVNRLRAQFMHALYAATVAHVRGQSAAADYARAETLVAEAQRLVTSRHSDLHDTHRRRLLDSPSDDQHVLPNATSYQYGYLYHADFLCFWNRELQQVGNLIGESTTTPFGCLFGRDRPKTD
jgi:hypothetical protein